ncbi:peptidoglycan-binding domain-containing protein [Streptodolium elevatio]|uniref:Peptidoglycan-binding domain-containing protein n=1 Tax=Streptodolium elevatio TaxID=3157996 RepID=A0ABV3DVD3_9ACTN
MAVGAVTAGVAAAPPAAAAVHCDNWTSQSAHGTQYSWLVPSVGNNTGQTNCVLSLDDYNNTAVWVLQLALNECYGQGLTHDGDYGPSTRQAVVNVQTFHGFPPADRDGVYGPQTRNAMEFPAFSAGGTFLGCWWWV